MAVNPKLSRFGGIGGHHSNRPLTVEWLTPPSILTALGGAGSFDLDPATPDLQPWPTAKHRYTKADDGLVKPWFGRVWLNPPYTNGIIGRWLEKLASHGSGTTIIFARTETDAFFRHVWEQGADEDWRGSIMEHIRLSAIDAQINEMAERNRLGTNRAPVVDEGLWRPGDERYTPAQLQQLYVLRRHLRAERRAA